MQRTFEESSHSGSCYEVVVASRDGEFISTVQALAASLPTQLQVRVTADADHVETNGLTAAVVVDRRSLLGLGGSVIARPMPEVPVLCVLDGAEGAALEALRRGAWDVLVPPFEARDLQRLMEPLVAEGVRRAGDRELIKDFYSRLNALTDAESEVMEAVCDGKLNKQIARELNVSIRTVEQRRRRVFTKMDVPSAVPLACRVSEVRTIERLSRPATLSPPPADPLGHAPAMGPAPPAPTRMPAIAVPTYSAAPMNQPC
ncbi:Tetrathionate response regulatory protein TtrR [Posidoniimonas polymericola]|uniref:Tetrathionate response regulatory protein TtrR n=1 Tax=Posidoniimonas polymericola TaxID=2528002 RepID=A0A5C5ZEH5_9BACT|nr:LuxR C-terminal-related transcriptional regulator [Posidoniimonas polymericola]TWT85540.1 Tetrathionate response regulatory protein TtrR [Posidoniimonas polymericola]